MRKFLANALYLFCGLPLALSALLLIAARPWALDRDFYRKALSDPRLYEAVAAAAQAGSRDASSTIDVGGETLDGAALGAALGKNLPADALRDTALRAAGQALDLVEGADRDGRFDLDLKPLKAAIRSRAPAIARDYAAALPSRPELPAPGDFSYRPASLSPKAAEAKAAQLLGSRIDAMPDAVSAPADARVTMGGRPTFLSRALVDRTALSLAAFSGLFIAGLAALGGTGIAGRIAKAGRYLLPPSIAVLALGALLSLPGSPVALATLPPEARQLLSGPAAAALRDYAASVLGLVARGFFVTGLVGASLGGLLASAKRIAEPKELE